MWGCLEDEGEFQARGWPGCGLGDPLGAGFPLESGLDGICAEADELEGVGIGGESGQPFRQEIIMGGLSGEAPDGVGLSVESDFSLGAD